MPSLSPCGWASDKLPLRICYFPDLFEDFACEVVIKNACRSRNLFHNVSWST
jgi:hypothetical protein